MILKFQFSGKVMTAAQEKVYRAFEVFQKAVAELDQMEMQEIAIVADLSGARESVKK